MHICMNTHTSIVLNYMSADTNAHKEDLAHVQRASKESMHAWPRSDPCFSAPASKIPRIFMKTPIQRLSRLPEKHIVSQTML